MKHPKLFFRLVLILAVLVGGLLSASARPLRLLVIGNSFSANATHYLPELAKAGGHELTIARAQAPGCPLERHWKALAVDLADSHDAGGKIYGGKSLREIMGEGEWDIITIQQYSLLSGDIDTYHPFAENLCAELKKLQPKAEIVVHQTWAYRSDAEKFGFVGAKKPAANQREMWEKSRTAYWQLATEHKARVIPTGDAFWRIDSDKEWGYKPDAKFNFKDALPPALPDQRNSLHVGYTWQRDQKLGKDFNHANVAGEYLGALVWYGFLFKESPERLTFIPKGVTPEFAVRLRKIAWDVVNETAEASSASQKKDPATR